MTPRDVRSLPPVEEVPLSSVKPHPRNPRKIPERAVEMVAASLSRFGWQQPLVVDADGVLVAGHTRMRAAKSLGLKTVPVIRTTDLTPEEVDAFRIADNRTHDFTAWDYPVLVAELEPLSADFSDVLALEDWNLLVQDFQEETPEVELDPESSGALTGGFQLVVAFPDEESAKAVEREIMDLPGVLDIRYRRKEYM